MNTLTLGHLLIGRAVCAAWKHPEVTLYVGLSGRIIVCKWICVFFQNTVSSSKSSDGLFLGLDLRFGPTPGFHTIRVTLGCSDGLFCYFFCYIDWALYPVYPLCMWLWGIGMVCLVVSFCVLILVQYPKTTLYMWGWGVCVGYFILFFYDFAQYPKPTLYV